MNITSELRPNIAETKEWQTLVGAKPDGFFGPQSQIATLEYAKAQGLIGKPVNANPVVITTAETTNTEEKVDERSESIISGLNIHVQQKFRDLVLAVNKKLTEGKVGKFISGYRSPELQQELYDKFLNGGPKAAPPWASWHQSGFAGDWGCFDTHGNYIDEGPEYDIYGETAREMGFHWGADFGDRPHVSFRPPSLEGMGENAALAVIRQRYQDGQPLWS